MRGPCSVDPRNPLLNATGNLLSPVHRLRSSSTSRTSPTSSRPRLSRLGLSFSKPLDGQIWPLIGTHVTPMGHSLQLLPRHLCPEHTRHTRGSRRTDRLARPHRAREPTLANIPERFPDARVYAGSTQNYVKEIFSVRADPLQWTHPLATHWGPPYADRSGNRMAKSVHRLNAYPARTPRPCAPHTV